MKKESACYETISVTSFKLNNRMLTTMDRLI